MPQKPSLDRIDRKILDILQRDGRISNQRLSEAVALSPSACLARLRRLEKEEVITGYKAQVDAAKLGPNLTVSWALMSSITLCGTGMISVALCCILT